MKRFMDLLLASLGLMVLFPIISCTAILIKFKLGSPIIFKQQRPGLHGNLFHVYKFRTMTNARDSQGELLPDHLRLTPFGKFLRKLSIDEFPQLFNVIKGEMSLIGPRPLLTEYLTLYTEEQGKRHNVKPGITGWAQINGRNAITWEEKFKLDVWYVENQSFMLDLKILFFTVKKVITSDGISSQNHVTMPDFKGNVPQNQQNYTSL